MGEVAVSKSGPRAMASRRTAIAAVAIALGLAGRLLWLPLHGTHDMDVFAGWGDQTMRFGLAHAYYGIYYPLQYQLFAVSSWLASSTGLGTIAAYKLVTLCFDAGAVVLLALLLRRLGADPFYALVLWLQPYFLAISWLGYTDAQFAFFVLLGLTVAAYLPSPAGYLAGGFGLGAAFLMKPQATLLVGVGGALLAATLVKERHRLLHPLARRPFCLALLLVGPTVIFAAYTLYFDAKGGGLTYLARSYQRVLAHPSSALTENMPNVWYPVANLVRSPSEPIYAVTGRPLYHDVAALVTLLLLAGIVVLVVRRPSRSLAVDVTCAFALAAAVLPMTMTHAHENHFFAAAVLGIVPLALARSTAAWVGYHVTLLAQFANLVGLYAFGTNGVSDHRAFTALTDLYYGHHSVPVVLSLTAAAGFAVYVVALVRAWPFSDSDRATSPARATTSIWPASGLQGSRR